MHAYIQGFMNDREPPFLRKFHASKIHLAVADPAFQIRTLQNKDAAMRWKSS